jgi:NodT family efflux transporter outer membrane factor (OMF) lipoprotein
MEDTMPRAYFTAKLACAVAGAAVLAGCAVPHVEPRVRLLTGPAAGLAAGSTLPPRPDWWRTLGDPRLDRIMADALAGNPSLEEAMARVRAARARIGEREADQLPHVGLDGEADRERLTGRGEIPAPFAGATRWVGDAQADLSWTLDFAGRQKALIDQSRRLAAGTGLDLAAARVVLTGAVAQAYVDLTRAEQQQRIAEDFVQSRAASLRLAQTKQRSRLASDFDIEAASTLLAQARQARARADGDRAVAVHALAALAGRGAEYYATVGASTLDLDAALPLPAALPADLLDRRPDLLAARARLDAASAGRRVARADFYPTVDLRAFAGVSAVGLSQLVSSQALTYGAGPSVHAPIFEGGRLRATYKEATADIDIAAAAYDDLATRAIREAADALSLEASTAAQAARQHEVVSGLAATVRLDQIRVRSGLGTQLDVLASGERRLQARQTEIDLAAQGAIQRIRLLIALGGDFDPTPINPAAAASGAAH